MKYWIISDTHFNHKSLIQLCWRPKNFEDRLFRSLMQIQKEDVLIHLWDVCLWWDQYAHDTYIKPLQCKKILVRGNHDRKTNWRYLSNWRDFVCDSFELNIYGKDLLFTHIPRKYDWVNIHGHRHNIGNNIKDWRYNGILYACEYEQYEAKELNKFLLRNGVKHVEPGSGW